MNKVIVNESHSKYRSKKKNYILDSKRKNEIGYNDYKDMSWLLVHIIIWLFFNAYPKKPISHTLSIVTISIGISIKQHI